MVAAPRKLRLFVVDDDEVALTAHAAMLEAAGHEVTTEVDAASAIPLITRKRPDAVLVDVVMGGTDGLAFCRLMRERRELDDTAIIAVTQLGHAEYWRGRLREVGAIGLISKPITPASVAEIERLLAKRG